MRHRANGTQVAGLRNLRSHLSLDHGSVTILGIAAAAVLVGAGLVLMAILQAAIMRAQMGSFADLAALAASQAQLVGADPCAAAAHIAQRNSVTLISCQGELGGIEVVVRGQTPRGGLLSLIAPQLHVSARAG
jgi:secretion/DNA translocation related TadE-like protein